MSRVLKGDSGRVIQGEVFDAQTQARRILDEARAEADAIRAEAEAAREAARREGFEAGRQEGLAQVTEVLLRARAEAARLAEASEAELRRLAVRIAEKVLGRELSQSESAVVDVVRTALQAARSRREITVRVSPDDLTAVGAGRARLMEALSRHPELSIRADESVQKGGCLIDTEVGTIDARLEVQLAAIERALCGDGD